MFGRSKPPTKRTGLVELEPRDDFVARAFVGRRGQRHPRHAGKVLAQYVETEVVLAEVVAPLRHAVRFVDGDQRNRQRHQPFQRARAATDVPARHTRDRVRRLRRRRARCSCACQLNDELRYAARMPICVSAVDLVAHQRDQRRNDDAGAVAQQTRQLITERFAAAGRHQHEAIATGERGFDHVVLLASERGIPIGLRQQLACAIHHSADHSRIVGLVFLDSLRL